MVVSYKKHAERNESNNFPWCQSLQKRGQLDDKGVSQPIAKHRWPINCPFLPKCLQHDPACTQLALPHAKTYAPIAIELLRCPQMTRWALLPNLRRDRRPVDLRFRRSLSDAEERGLSPLVLVGTSIQTRWLAPTFLDRLDLQILVNAFALRVLRSPF